MGMLHDYRCFGWMCLCNPQTGGYCKKKMSKGGDRYPQISAKHVQFEFSLRLPNGIATSHDLTVNDSLGSGNLFQTNKYLAK